MLTGRETSNRVEFWEETMLTGRETNDHVEFWEETMLNSGGNCIVLWIEGPC